MKGVFAKCILRWYNNFILLTVLVLGRLLLRALCYSEKYLHWFLICEVSWQSRCSFGEINEKPSWKLENVVSNIYKTISNINIVFSNCLQIRYIFAIFSPWMIILVGKVAISASLKKIHFPKISDQAPLRISHFTHVLSFQIDKLGACHTVFIMSLSGLSKTYLFWVCQMVDPIINIFYTWHDFAPPGSGTWGKCPPPNQLHPCAPVLPWFSKILDY